MTFAPRELLDLQAYWRAQKGVSLGIVGDTAHQAKGVSYHLGKSQLTTTAYSRRTARDRAGLSEAASAIDLGRLDGSLANLRTFSAWFAARCRTGSAAYNDVREVIWWDPKSATVLGWSDLDPNRYIAGYGDLSHKTHTHISFYRDSEARDKTAMFKPYFGAVQPPAGGDAVGPTFTESSTIGVATTTKDISIIATSDGEFHPVTKGYVRNVTGACTITDGKYKGSAAYLVKVPGKEEMGLLLASAASYVPNPPPAGGDCTDEITKRDEEWRAWVLEGSPS